jgi:hypothetical protein
MLTRAHAPRQVRKKYLGAAAAVQTGAGQVLPARGGGPIGFARIVALHYSSSTLYQIC